MAPARPSQPPAYAPRKRPRQQRAQATFDAIVDAAARLLPAMGYAGITTNHVAERAGVAIASLYEYFPDKDAVIAEVAERLVARVMARLGAALTEIVDARRDDAMRAWLGVIHETLLAERALIAVLVDEVPYTRHLPTIRDLGPMLLRFSEAARLRAGDRVQLDEPRASLRLMVNLVSSTLLQLVIDPPDDVPAETMLDVLARRLEAWIAGGPRPLG
jgi:AcrR family transcriptional regulator